MSDGVDGSSEDDGIAADEIKNCICNTYGGFIDRKNDITVACISGCLNQWTKLA